MVERLNLQHSIIGHEKTLETLLHSACAKRLPSTFLFVGPDGVGRKKVALAVAQTLLCETTQSNDPAACGLCGACLRLAKMQSEALLLLAPEKNVIKIEQATKILEFLSLRAISRARIVIIDSAHLLNPTAANTLLKILEEPPENCYFFLIAPGPQHVLSTLRSRAQVVRFSALSIQDMKRKSVKAAAAPEWALRASQGSFSRLASFQDEEELATRDSSSRFLNLWLDDKKAFITPEWRDMVKERGAGLSLARYCGLLLRDAILAKASQAISAKELQKNAQIINADQLDLVSRLASLEMPKIQQLSQKFFEVEKALAANRDSQLAFEELWLS